MIGNERESEKKGEGLTIIRKFKGHWKTMKRVRMK
jgi:hypothetical protein